MTEAIVRWRFEALGEVQRVGYRDRVRRSAKLLGLVGWVENDPKDEDRVLFEAQGPPSAVARLLEAVRGKEGLGDASQVQRLEELPADPSLDRFRIRVDPDPQQALQERVDEAALYLGGTFALGQATLEVGREALSVGQANLAIGRETLAVSKETLAVRKETLAVRKEALSAVREGNAVLGGKIDSLTDVIREEGRRNAAFRHDLTGAVSRLEAQHGDIRETLRRTEKDARARSKPC